MNLENRKNIIDTAVSAAEMEIGNALVGISLHGGWS